MSEGRSRRSASTRRADVLFGYLIPLFFMGLAAYQELKNNAIDKYVVGSLLVFGLGALGWRIDTMFERYLEAKAGIRREKDEVDEH
jgi:hypothetical protein